MTMITCPVCKNKEMPGAFFCSKCGNRLVNPGESSTDQIETLIVDHIERIPIPPFPKPPSEATDSKVALLVIKNGVVIHVRGKDDFTLGRSTKGQTIIPDIDLNPFHAYEAGVSRLHANLIISDTDIFIHDLGSANGTRLNGEKIDPHLDYAVKHGDRLSLGQLKIQVLIKDQ